jgi:hypothetical protein
LSYRLKTYSLVHLRQLKVSANKKVVGLNDQMIRAYRRSLDFLTLP